MTELKPHKKTKIKTLRHDQLFKAAVLHKKAAEEFIEIHAPAHITADLDIASVEPQKDTFVSQKLSRYYCDALFKMKYKGDDAYLYFLAELQTKPDPMMPLRMLKYMTRIWEKWEKDQKERQADGEMPETHLPVIIPLLYYASEEKWNVAAGIEDMTKHPDIQKEFLSSRYHMIDLEKIPDNKLKEHAYAGTLGFFLKHRKRMESLRLWQEALKGNVKILIQKKENKDFVTLFVEYSLTHADEDDRIELNNLIENLEKNEENQPMANLAQKLYDDGINEGFAQGKNAGIHEGIQQGFAQGKNAGIHEGIQQGIQTVAIQMLKAGSDVKVVQSFTNLSLEEIQKLKSKL